MPMPLNQFMLQAESSTLIRELTLDSRAVKAGDLFLAIPGTRSDGRDYIADAIGRGAAAVAYESEGAPQMSDSAAQLLPVKGLAQQLSAIAGRFYGEPSRGLHLVGVTGTNGKTFDSAVNRSGLMACLGKTLQEPDRNFGCRDISAQLASGRAYHAGCDCCPGQPWPGSCAKLEHRCRGHGGFFACVWIKDVLMQWPFETAVFSNLTL